jgi:hydrogenase maturation protease
MRPGTWSMSSASSASGPAADSATGPTAGATSETDAAATAAATGATGATGGPAEAATTDGASASVAADVLVVGLGNPILGDDAVGWHVADAVEARLDGRGAGAGGPRVEVERLAVGGLSLMERLVGYRRAILVDALLTGSAAPGTVSRLSLDEVPGGEAGHLDSVHDASLRDALVAGRAMGASLPVEIVVIAVEAAQVVDFSEEMTPAVAAAVPEAVEAVLAAIDA